MLYGASTPEAAISETILHDVFSKDLNWRTRLLGPLNVVITGP